MSRPIQFLKRTYARTGARGVVDFILWALRTRVEKLRIRFEDRFKLYSYQKWIRDYEKENPAPRVAPVQSSILASFLLLVPSSTDPERQPAWKTLQSVLRQRDPNWEFILVGPGAADLGKSLSIESSADPRIRIQQDVDGQDKDAALAAASAFARGKWLIWTRAGDLYADRLVSEIAQSDGEIVYWDEDILRNGIRSNPFLKPDWSPELWLSIDLLYCSAFRLASVQEAVFSAPETSLTPALLHHAKTIRHVPKILSHCQSAAWTDPLARAEHERRVLQFLERQGIHRAQTMVRADGSLRLHWPLPAEKISIIIPSKNNYALLYRCIQSILQNSVDEDYEIVLVDDASTEAELMEYYRQLKSTPHAIHIVAGKSPFNYSAACNLGARAATGAYLLFLNNDTQVLDATWLHELRAFARLDGVGMVGAKLLFPDRTIQHAGIVLGIEGHASHVFLGADERIITPYGSPNWYRNYSAVTGACMLMRRTLFEEIGGFDEAYRLVFSDVEIGLRAIEKGYRVVVNPEVRLVHYEGKSRGKFIPEEDIQRGYERFEALVRRGDPFYNPGLSCAWRIPTLKRPWEQSPIERLQKIVRYL